jgi:hypothetical protein
MLLLKSILTAKKIEETNNRIPFVYNPSIDFNSFKFKYEITLSGVPTYTGIHLDVTRYALAYWEKCMMKKGHRGEEDD